MRLLAPVSRCAAWAIGVAGAIAASTARAEGPPVDVWVDADHPDPTRPVRDPTAASFTVEGPELDRPGRSVADSLARVPGVEVTRSGGGADLATASLRGATSAQTPIHLAGVRLNDDLTGTADLAGLPTWLLRRVEVDRGNAPTAAGRLGLGGAIFFDPILPTRPLARASFGGGSFGQRELRAAGAFGGPRAGALVAVRHEQARDDYAFLDDRGTRFDSTDDVLRSRVNADHVQDDAWVLGRFDWERGSVRTVLNALSREQGAPGLQLVPASHARAALQRGLGGMSGDVRCGLRGCAVEWGVDALVTRYRLTDPGRELGGALSTETAGERSRQHVRVRVRPQSSLEVGVGLAQEVQHLAVVRDGIGLSARRHVLHGDVEARLQTRNRIDWVALAAVDCHSTTASGSATACGILAPSARLGARVRAARWLDVFANVGRYLREPTLGELYGISSALRGNDELRPETGYGLDIGLSSRGRHGALDGYAQIDGFARFADDLIAFRRSSFGAVRPYNVASARVVGAEAAAGVAFAGWLRGSLALTWLDARDTSADRLVVNDVLPFRSRFVAAPALEVRVPGARAIGADELGATLRWLHRSARTADPAGLIVLPALSQLDLEFDAAFGRHAALRVRVANLLDQRTVDLLGYPLPGRAGYATVELRW